jgi:AraC-like DNA-binding protein
LVSHDVPVTSRITRASAAEPYVALILNLDLDLVRSLHEVLAEIPPAEAPGGPLATTRADLAWGAPLARYLELAAAPLDARVLGPAVLREIHYRLLLTPIGARLRALLLAGSPASRIAKAIRRMRTGFRDPLAIPDLARTAGMSPSSFHQHFKAVTGTTPLRYRKELRLIEARGLLAGRGQSVSQAAFAVGYQSPTHFSRDYSRKFGRAPSLDGTAVA